MRLPMQLFHTNMMEECNVLFFWANICVCARQVWPEQYKLKGQERRMSAYKVFDLLSMVPKKFFG